MRSRQWDLDNDYSILCAWFKEREWDSPIPKESLPVRGIMIEDDNSQPICACGLYVDVQSNFGFMYGLFSKLGVGKIELFKAMKLCVEGIKKEAENNKLGIVYTITGEDSLDKLYVKHMSMIPCENSVRSYVMDLNNHKNLDWIQ
tara:strand:- start:123 stop:557 length:435 start_codon:yes stop_codon:yes gene_type:complete